METPKYFRPVTLLAASIGLFQSIAWFVLSLLGILAYRCVLNAPTYESQSDQFPVAVVKFYFEGPECPAVNSPLPAGFLPTELIKPAILHGWMSAYLAFDITYFFISLAVLYWRNSPGPVLLNLVRAWCVNTGAFLIMDIWLTFEFGFDYEELWTYLDQNPTFVGLEWVTSVPGALMAISARGFILWFLNLALLIYFVSYVINWKKLCESPKSKRHSPSPPPARRTVTHQDAYLKDPAFHDIIQNYNRPRASIDSWSDDRQIPIIPTHHENRTPQKVWESNPVQTRWEEYHSPASNPNEGVTRFSIDDIRSFPPRKQQVFDSEPIPRPNQSQFRSHGPASDYRSQLKEVIQKNNTERRQREAPMSLEEDQRITRNNNRSDFNHDIKNFQQGQRSSKIDTKPFGQPVRVPPPPPPPALPKSNDAYYY